MLYLHLSTTKNHQISGNVFFAARQRGITFVRIAADLVVFGV